MAAATPQGAASPAAASPAAPLVGVLALQGDVAEHVRALRASGAEPAAVRRPEELDRVAGLIIPGGESTTIWKLIDIFGLAEIMLADRLPDPASGQQTLGGIDMTVRRNAFGRQVDSFERDLDITGLDGRPYRAVFIRAPWVEEVGPGVEVLATDPGASRIVAVRQGRALATSFHPELTPDWRIHKMFVDMVRDEA